MRRKRNARRERPGLFYARKAKWPIIARRMLRMERAVAAERAILARMRNGDGRR